LSSVVEKVQNKFGERFDPKLRAKYGEGLTRLLVRELPELSKEVVIRALDQTFNRYRIAIDWNRFICYLATLLPGWWVKLSNNPGFDASTMLLLTDGTVMCQEQGGRNWKKLTPDAQGSYVNGTWSDLAPMNNTRRYYASAVLQDGRVFVSGGEYSDAGAETNTVEIYDYGHAADGTFYYVMEYLPGLSLAELIEKHGITFEKATAARQAASSDHSECTWAAARRILLNSGNVALNFNNASRSLKRTKSARCCRAAG
jgi:serine/threonine protein kinase